MNAKVLHVPVASLHEVWTQVEPYVTLAVDTGRGECNSEWFRRGIQDGKMDLFVAVEEDGSISAAMITQFLRHQLYTSLRILTIGGEKDMFALAEDFFPRLKSWSLAHGATVIDAFCHQGMARLLQKKFGFGERYSFVALHLNQGDENG